MKKILATLLALSLTFGSVALPAAESGAFLKGVTISANAEETDDGLEYSELDDGTIEISGYNGDNGNVVIPSVIDGKKVTSIGEWAFGYCENLTSITIPDSITNIGNGAFECCEKLASITIPDSVISIGDSAFYECESLTSIALPNNITNISNSAFKFCENLTNITIPKGVTSIGDSVFYNCKSLISITIPDSVTNIGDEAFYECESLTDIVLPNSITSIGNGTFNSCGSLKSITIPNGVTSIGDSAFNDCESLTSITIPNSVTSIGAYAFGYCNNLTSATILDGVTEIGESAFDNCEKLKELSIPNSVTKIGDRAFYSCKSLRSIVLPSNIKEINENVFAWCISLNDVTLNDGLTKIGKEAFYNCEKLSAIVIPDSVTEIDDEAFRSCESLEEITIPHNVTKIGLCVFTFGNPNMNLKVDEANPTYSAYAGNLYNKNKTKLLSVINSGILELPKTVAEIDSNAFAYWGVRHINIEDGNDNFVLEKGSLYNKDKTELILADCTWSYDDSHCVIPNGVEKIRAWALNFNTASSYNSVYIPSSIKEIEDNAFWESKIDDIYYEGSEAEWKSIKVNTEQDSENDCIYTANIHFNHTHSYSLSDDVDEAGCDYDGNEYYVCECGDYYTETLPATGHSYEEDSRVEPTCTKDGYIEWYCTNCGDWYTDTIPAKGHTIVTDEAIPATCTTAGKTEGSHCSVCGEVIKAQTEIKATGHKSSDWIIDKEASIGVKGSKHTECTVCKKVLETEEIPALSKTNINSASVTLSTSTYAYDGKAKTPSVTVKVGGKTLKKDTDYTVSYSNNTKVGTATVKITGKGNYTGTISKTYSIKNDFTKATVSGISTKAYTGKAITQSITVKYNGKTLKNGTDYTVSYSNNTKVGTATIKIVGNGSYTGTITKTFSIKNNFTKSTVSGISTKAYTGKAQTQKITVKFNGKTLKNGTDYTVSYSNNTKVGTATVKIVGKGSYTGTITKTFKINPAKQTINKLSAKSKGFTASWSKKDHATGYEIQYSTDSKFKSVSKSTITNKATTSKTFTKLKANKKYYVRMRIYTTVKGTKYYGAWSSTKTVTTKK